MTTNSNLDDDKLHDIAEKIQVGDAAEGAEALRELLEHARGSSGGTTGQAIRQELAMMRLEGENQEALQRFAKRWSKVAQDEDIAEVGMKKLAQNMADDLRGIGVSDEILAPLKGDVRRLAQAHTMVRAQGHKVRSPDELLEETGRQLGEKFRIEPTARTPQEVVQDARRNRGAGYTDRDVSVRDDRVSRVRHVDPPNVHRSGAAARRVEQATEDEGSTVRRASTTDDATLARRRQQIDEMRAARGYARFGSAE